MKSRLSLTTLLMSAFALLATVGLATAQELTPERVQIALDLTDRRIEQAAMLLSSADNARARIEFDAANTLQTSAKQASTSNQLMLAMRLTLEARGHADRAIYMLKGPNPDGVDAQLERTRDMLERARDRIEDCDQQRARAMLHAALDMQQRAEGAARDGRYLAALQLTMSARERGLHAMRLCRVEDNLRDSSDRALRQTDEILSRAQDVVAERGSEPARQALARATDLQSRAWAEYGAQKFDSSVRLTDLARSMARRAIRFAGGTH
jgi:hypothetical protein